MTQRASQDEWDSPFQGRIVFVIVRKWDTPQITPVFTRTTDFDMGSAWVLLSLKKIYVYRTERVRIELCTI